MEKGHTCEQLFDLHGEVSADRKENRQGQEVEVEHGFLPEVRKYD